MRPADRRARCGRLHLGSGDHARGTVLAREGRHPDRVTDPVAFFVGDRAHVDVQGLSDISVGICRASVQAAQFAVGAEHVPHVVEHLRQHNRATEHVSLVHEVREPMRVFLRAEFTARRSLYRTTPGCVRSAFSRSLPIPDSRTTYPDSSS